MAAASAVPLDAQANTDKDPGWIGYFGVPASAASHMLQGSHTGLTSDIEATGPLPPPS
jgi:hypothetical protein